MIPTVTGNVLRPCPRIFDTFVTNWEGENLVTTNLPDIVLGKPATEELPGLRTLVNFLRNAYGHGSLKKTIPEKGNLLTAC